MITCVVCNMNIPKGARCLDEGVAGFFAAFFRFPMLS